MDLGLRDQAYVVTGGSSGLGRATAQVLLDEGAGVVVTGRDQDRLDACVADLGARAVGEVADNADPEVPQRLVEVARERFGRLDGALISVGGPATGSMLDTPDADWQAGWESVFLGGLRLGRTIGQALGDGGALAFVLSTSVRSPLPGLAVSNGLRPGLAMVAKSLADELGPRGVRVNSLLPGRVETERVAYLDSRSDDPEATRRRHEGRIPLGRYGRPEEFGRAAAFLLSPAASYVTGTCLTVDGGALRAL